MDLTSYKYLAADGALTTFITGLCPVGALGCTIMFETLDGTVTAGVHKNMGTRGSRVAPGCRNTVTTGRRTDVGSEALG